MANETYQNAKWVTPLIIGKEALMILRNQAIMPKLVYTDYSSEFVNVGDTINVRRPTIFKANSMIGNTTTVQNVIEGNVQVKMDHWPDVSFALTSKDKTLILPVVSDRVIKPAVVALVEQVESDLLSLVSGTYSYIGTPGTPISSLNDLSNARKQLFKQKTPFDGDISMMLDPEATGNVQPLLTVLAGGSAPRPEAMDGLTNSAITNDIYGMKPHQSQLIPIHTPGTLSGGALASGTGPVGQVDALTIANQLISVASGGNGGTLVPGDILAFTGVEGTYAVVPNTGTADGSYTASAGGVITWVNIYPNLPVGATLAGAAITVLPAHTANMAFHRNAFGLVVRPLSLPESVRAEIVTDDVTGLSVRVVFGWDTNTQSEIISIGMLYGVTVLDPRLATRILG